ncbi:MAG: LysE family translocator [Actinomycetota bacterium]|nr:LysE family translocator [Actinomycetota bacterium]
MVSTDHLLGFAVAAFILIAIPGPSVVFVIGRALAYGRGVALATVIGNSFGLFLIAAAVALGLGAIVEQSIMVYTAIKVVGAAYLVWLGIQAIRHRKDFSVARLDDRHGSSLPLLKAARQGFVVGISNPKAFIIFASVLPQFIDRGEGQVQAQMMILGLVAFTIGLVSDSVWAVIASQLRTWFNASPKRGELLGTVGGTSMIGLGIGVAVTGNNH